MSSATDNEPAPEEERGLESARRGRGRRLPWKRKEDDAPELGELDADDVNAFMRLSAAAEDDAVEADVVAAEPPSEDEDEESVDVPEDLAVRVASRARPEPQ